MTTFSELKLSAPLLRALEDEGYSEPTPIQAKAIPAMLDGADVLGLAQTGTGKTAAFTLPMLQRLDALETRPKAKSPRALVLTPTRELASQIGEAVRAYGRHLRLRHTVVFGGVGQGPQVRALQHGVDILIATPGRLLDLMNQRRVSLDAVEFFVLDEADRMLDLGFIQPIRKIAAAVPAKRQTLLFSATMPQEIARLAESLQHDPVRVEAQKVSSAAPRIDQQVLFVARANKRALLENILAGTDVERALVFTRTKRGADRVLRGLDQAGVQAAAIHGNKSQGARETALKGFRLGRVRVLVATDIAARGIDVDGISHVINYDMPDTPEAYVHRIGRTARAGAAGTAMSLCDETETGQLRDIERMIGGAVPVLADHPFHAQGLSEARPAKTSGGRNAAPSRKRTQRQGDTRKAEAPQRKPRQRGARQNDRQDDRQDDRRRGEPRQRDARPAETRPGEQQRNAAPRKAAGSGPVRFGEGAMDSAARDSARADAGQRDQRNNGSGNGHKSNGKPAAKHTGAAGGDGAGLHRMLSRSHRRGRRNPSPALAK